MKRKLIGVVLLFLVILGASGCREEQYYMDFTGWNSGAEIYVNKPATIYLQFYEYCLLDMERVYHWTINGTDEFVSDKPVLWAYEFTQAGINTVTVWGESLRYKNFTTNEFTFEVDVKEVTTEVIRSDV